MMTAHAMEHGVVLCYEDKAGTKSAMALSYEGEAQQISAEVASCFFANAEQDDYLPSEIRENLENSNYEGRTSSVSELAQAQIAYSIDDAGTPFTNEVLQWQHNGQLMLEEWPAELRRHQEVYRSETAEEIEPLTCEEAIWLVKVLGNETIDPVADARFAPYLATRMTQLAEMVEAYSEAVEELNWSRRKYIKEDNRYTTNRQPLMPRWKGFYHIIPEIEKDEDKEQALGDLMRRLIHTVKTNSLGGPWTYASRYRLADREGITDITEEISVRGATPQAQYIDCDLPDLEKQARETSLFAELFDHEGKNRGWPDRARYFWRKEQERIERFRSLLDAIYSLSIPTLIKYFGPMGENLEQVYKESVRQCSPGPARAQVEGKWTSVPLVGHKAQSALLARGYRKESLHPQVRFHKGGTWHKLYLTAEMISELQKALQIRLRQGQRLNELAVKSSTQLPAERDVHELDSHQR